MRVVVMGGTSGIGQAVADRLAGDGAEVIVTGRDAERLAAVRKASAERVDGTDDAQVSAFFERVGTIDHLVLAFSPGAIGMGPIREIPFENVRASVEGKLLAYLFAIQRADVTGSITMVSAASARAAYPGTATLAAVNGAIERMVSPLAAELAPVRVNAVSPGVIDTPWWSFLPAEHREAQFAQVAEQLPLKRIGRPEEVADAVAYLVGAGFVTGTVLAVDGGATVA